MSESHVIVVKIGQITPHPNADALDITKVFDYQVIIRKGEFQEGDLAVYIPVDSIVPKTEKWEFLGKHRRIDAKRLRGIFSQGLLAALPPPGDEPWKEGDNVQEVMGITKYDPAIVYEANTSTGGDCEAAPLGWIFTRYTDLEGIRRYPNVLSVGEEVIISEKLHGCCYRVLHDGDRLWVGSRTQIKRPDENTIWWQVAAKENLAEKTAKAPMKIFFGELYGQVQDLKYGIQNGCKFRVFDVLDVASGRYFDHDDAVSIATACGLEWVPILYRGPWSLDLNALCEGQSTLADNVREGFVVKPIAERWDHKVGRVILKRAGEGYLLRKQKKLDLAS